MKRKETLLLEKKLKEKTREKRVYGCEEVTIGFHGKGGGKEIVDFMSMDSKGILKCYEIKVSLADLKSNAKKSWYGHYNYLVVTKDLFSKISDWDEFIPNHVGILCGESLTSKRKAAKVEISPETENMLKESMVRSLYWKLIKTEDANNLEKQKALFSKIRRLQKEKEEMLERALCAERVVFDYEMYKYLNEGFDIDLSREVKKEKEKYREQRRK